MIEMKPKWYSLKEIPYSEMWSDDKHWLPLLLKGLRFCGYFKFEGQTTITDFVLSQIIDNNYVLKPIEWDSNQ